MPTLSRERRLTRADHERIAEELDALRREVTASLGARDAAYIRRLIAVQRGLDAAGRVLLLGGRRRPLWIAGTAALAVAKILENMEIGHNVMHGQWDWMRDPKIHSTTWEWDAVCPSSQWKHSHNVVHHTYTNVLGKDRDVGYTILRVTPEQEWHPAHLAQPLYNVLLALTYEYGIAVYDLDPDAVEAGEKSPEEFDRQVREIRRKLGRQAAKDYLVFPLLAGRGFVPALLGTLTANVLRNVWAHTIIFCGHFPGDVEVFPEDRLAGETKGEWYVRQLTGSSNIEGGRLFHVLNGNLGYQIEHHLFPDMPSNRLAEIAPRVRALCAKYDLPYNTGRLSKQVASTWTKIIKLSAPPPGAWRARRGK
ncbi:fatty acid desaturase family protein [Actinomadura rayongensis]|uniref:Acyl-CoA desaturase n=1 Tax=Actinomadura rayongensis TaxID=1429076 RepID=A0A6I4W291_9ACTN|nr:acyl-CoA desaturase [Actinomadura rayongensis]MXQ63593.1 acyl-CoA desaturase [Actinomadura rayongensis]